jgi:hypothetical protein
MIDHIGDVFHDNGERSAGFDIPKIFNIEPGPGIMTESLGMVGYLTEFRTAYAGESLTWRAADENVDGEGDVPQVQLFGKLRWRRFGDIAGN